MKTKIYIGTSGWHYKHWRGAFYPDSLPAKEFLNYYRKKFATAEINNSFYQLPAAKTLAEWSRLVPRQFIFSLKASRYITHMKKLKDPRQSTRKFFNSLGPLRDKIGPILLQLPPKWRCNPERLENFLKELPAQFRYVFEFRNPSWFNSRIYSILSQYRAAFCIYDLNRKLSPVAVTTDFIYIRLHGPEGPYQGKYNTKALNWWTKKFTEWQKIKKLKGIFCYFDNDQAGFAPVNALRLKRKLEKDNSS